MQAIAFANNDIAYIWWTIAHKIPGCLGFSVHRVDTQGHAQALPAFVGFTPGVPGQPHPMRNTDVWPIQSFQWKDVFAPPGRYRYRIIPMVGANPQSLKPLAAQTLETAEVAITGDYGDLQAYFNVGLISTQAITHQLKALVAAGTYPNTTDALRGEIAKEGSPVRKRLAGEVLDKGLLALLARATTEGGHCSLALYELTDRQLINAIEAQAAKHQLDLCLSNADTSEDYAGTDGAHHTRKVSDGTNKATRAELHAQHVPITDRFVPSSSIGHNKFVVYANKGVPQAVLSGSTNWTPTGLCSQTNNALLIACPTIAAGYADYHQHLVQDAALHPAQAAPLRQWCAQNPVRSAVDHGSVTAWFSPNTVRKTKDDGIPLDLAEVFALIHSATKGVLFLAFNPGTPSCLDEVRKKAEAMRRDGKPFFVRGAVTAPSPLGQFATFLTKRDALEQPDVLVTGVAGVPDDFSYWEHELYKLGHAVIHDKILVMDPFTPQCVVVTGSHNLGFKASYQNDENLVIVKGHRRLAEAYAAHVLDVTNHFAWRSKLAQLQKQGHMDKAWGDLDDTDHWQNKYFDGDSSASRDAFFYT